MGEATETIARLEDEVWKEKAKVKKSFGVSNANS